jgi:hypothetical protein
MTDHAIGLTYLQLKTKDTAYWHINFICGIIAIASNVLSGLTALHTMTSQTQNWIDSAWLN